MKFRLRLLGGQLDHVHLIQLFLAGHGHVPGGDAGLVAGHEVLQIRDLLLLPVVGGLQLSLFGGVNLRELIIISHVAGKRPVIHVPDQIDHAVEKRDVVGDQDEGVFIIQKVALQPFDVGLVQIVGGLIQQQDVRLFQKKLSQKDSGALAAGKPGHVLVQSDVRKAQRPAHLLHLTVDEVEVVRGQKLLDGAKLLHILFQLFLGSIPHFFTDLVHPRFQVEQEGKGGGQGFPDGGSLFQHRVLIQITRPHMSGPFDLSFVRDELSGDDVHEGGFALAVGSHQADVLSLEKAEGHVLKNGPVAEAVGQMLYVQYTHMKKLLRIFGIFVPAACPLSGGRGNCNGKYSTGKGFLPEAAGSGRMGEEMFSGAVRRT